MIISAVKFCYFFIYYVTVQIWRTLNLVLLEMMKARFSWFNFFNEKQWGNTSRVHCRLHCDSISWCSGCLQLWIFADFASFDCPACVFCWHLAQCSCKLNRIGSIDTSIKDRHLSYSRTSFMYYGFFIFIKHIFTRFCMLEYMKKIH